MLAQKLGCVLQELRAWIHNNVGNSALAVTGISFPSGVFVGIKRGDRLEIDGLPYRVKDVRVVADGSEINVEVSKS